MTRHFDYNPRWCSGNNQSVGLSVPVVSRWLWPGNRAFTVVANMVVTWWIVAFCAASAGKHEQLAIKLGIKLMYCLPLFSRFGILSFRLLRLKMKLGVSI